MKFLIVGLTGGIVSGKTTVAKYFKELGAKIIDVDIIAREIVRPQQKAWFKIVEYFGEDILKEDKEINRKKLAQIVFSNQEKLDLLNQITHPEIILLIKRQLNKIKDSSYRNVICIIEAPLLFEAHIEGMVDKIIVVYLNRENQINRLILRDNLSKDEAIKRIKSQMPIEKKIKLADYVIDNNTSINKTKKQIIKLWTELNNVLKKM